MIISDLKLKNFRRFDEFSITFNERLTVIAARNGQGKTTVLEGVVSALGPFVGSFDSSSSKHIQKSDARFYRVGTGFENEQAFPVEVLAKSIAPDLDWNRSLNSLKSKTTTRGAKPLSEYGAALSASLKGGNEITLPVMCYYPSSRLWSSHRNTSRRGNFSQRGNLTRSRSTGYRDCLSSASNFSQVEAWMKTATYAALQQSQQDGDERAGTALALNGIANAVDRVLLDEGWSRFHYSISLGQLAMRHDDHGILPASLLSDGVRATVMLVADLALRCAQLNSPLGENAPEETPGIVLIDEIGLHLHPAWQQRILASLMRAFPKIQFIVTTHSPQVVSTVSNEKIRVISSNTFENTIEYFAEIPTEQTEGVASSAILAEVFSVDPIPKIKPAGRLSEYTALVQQELYETPEGLDLRSKIISHFGEHHSSIREVDRLIRMQQMKKRFSEKNTKTNSE